MLEAIINEIKDGNKQAFENIIENYQQKLYAYCYYMLGNHVDAEDAVQEVLLRVYMNIRKFKKGSNFTAWLYTIAHNYCINFLKKKNIIKMMPLKLNFLKCQESIEKDIELKELNLSLISALNQLTPGERSLVLLRVLEEKKYKEITDILGTKPSTLRKKFQRAKEKLRDILQRKEGDIYEDYST